SSLAVNELHRADVNFDYVACDNAIGFDEREDQLSVSFDFSLRGHDELARIVWRVETEPAKQNFFTIVRLIVNLKLRRTLLRIFYLDHLDLHEAGFRGIAVVGHDLLRDFGVVKIEREHRLIALVAMTSRRIRTRSVRVLRRAGVQCRAGTRSHRER